MTLVAGQGTTRTGRLASGSRLGGRLRWDTSAIAVTVIAYGASLQAAGPLFLGVFVTLLLLS